MESKSPVIETDGLTRHFGDVTAVDELDLTVEDGEVYGFLGPNGAGKSTTIDMLLGFTRPTAGEATVLGHDVTADSLALRRRIGLLPEGYGFHENLGARRHVRSAIAAKSADDDPDELLDRVGLEPGDADRPVGDYSKGMTQRLALAVALVGSPDLLILDEPSSGLDPNGVRLLRDIVREEADRGATVFFSSHVLDQVERVCDRVGIMQNGRMTAVNSVDDLRSGLDVGAEIEVTVDEIPESFALADVEGATVDAVERRTVRVTCTRPAAKMRALAAIDEVATVEDVRIEEASLEAVFTRATGAGGAVGDAVADRDVDAEANAEADLDAEDGTASVVTANTGGE